MYLLSNHPPSIIKNIPAGINRRLSPISSDRESFEKAAPPYQRALDVIMYLLSNHPPSIIKNIPAGINRRLSPISSDRESFEKAAPPYQRALDASGYNHTLKFEPPRASPRRNRPRKNTLWYNPPFSKSVQTDIGKKFLTLVDKCFPHKNPLRKIFNRNTVKISYSCTSNIKQAIDNRPIMAKTPTPKRRTPNYVIAVRRTRAP